MLTLHLIVSLPSFSFVCLGFPAQLYQPYGSFFLFYFAFNQNLDFATCYLNIAETVNLLCKNEIARMKLLRQCVVTCYFKVTLRMPQILSSTGEFPVVFWKKSSLIKINRILLITLL